LPSLGEPDEKRTQEVLTSSLWEVAGKIRRRHLVSYHVDGLVIPVWNRMFSVLGSYLYYLLRRFLNTRFQFT
jgi:hypothetical protein